MQHVQHIHHVRLVKLLLLCLRPSTDAFLLYDLLLDAAAYLLPSPCAVTTPDPDGFVF